MRKQVLTVVATGFSFIAGLAISPAAKADGAKVDFVKDVQPILAASCVKCHGADPKGKKPKGKYDITTKEGMLKQGEHKDDIIPGQPEKSLFYTTLLAAVGSGDDEVGRMPYKKDPLSAEQIKILYDWIKGGAEWPDGVKVTLKE